MPTPRAGESRDEWLERCMGDPEQNEDFPEQAQRYAVCISKWESKAESYKPTAEMAEEAQRGLDWRKEFNRGGTEVGVARARDIANRRNLSEDTVKRMVSYFARHEVDKEGEGWSPDEDGYPSAGRIAWALWSGDPGRAWANKIASSLDSESAKSLFFSHLSALSASKSDRAIGTFLLDCITAFYDMASSASPSIVRDEILSDAALKIFSAGDGFKMLGIDARSVAAKMVEMQSFWDWADDSLVAKSMRWRSLRRSPSSIKSEVPITARVFCADPLPAIIFTSALLDFFPKSVLNIHAKPLNGDEHPNGITSNRYMQTLADDEKQMSEIQYKSLELELKREPDEDGVFEGYASVFGIVDQGMDVVERGAFTKSLSQRKPKMLWQHDTEKVIGVWDEVREDERGLYVKGRLLRDIEKGREAMALLKAGAIDSMSIGYRTVESIPEANGRVRKLTEVDLFEVSLVTFPMLPDAKVTAVKSIETPRDFERFLRDAGFSRKQSVAITNHGFKAIQDQRDAVEEEPVEQVGFGPLLAKLGQLQETLRHG